MKTPLLTLRRDSPLGTLCLAASPVGLCGIWFHDQQHFPAAFSAWPESTGQPVLTDALHWLDAYFAGDFTAPVPALDIRGGTAFQRSVWQALTVIPAGETRTYSALATALGKPGASRAVGAAVGRNPFSLLLPCHRVIGSAGSLTGYAGGLERKRWLLHHEQQHAGSALDRMR